MSGQPQGNKSAMERVMSFIVKKEWAPLALLFSLVVTIAALTVCIVNYQTTYEGLKLLGLPVSIALAFTMLNQGWQFAEPVIELSGVVDRLFPNFKGMLRTFWYATIVVDIVTAFVAFMSYEGITIAMVMDLVPKAIGLSLLNAVFAFIFLVGEIILYTGIFATKTSFDILIGNKPASAAPASTEDKPAAAPENKHFPESRHIKPDPEKHTTSHSPDPTKLYVFNKGSQGAPVGWCNVDEVKTSHSAH
jgi:hypothetical protein